MHTFSILTLSFCSTVLGYVVGSSVSPPRWSVLKTFTNLVTFGDSFTDESRLSYFINHNGSAPPPGTLLPESTSTPGGGITWDRWVNIYSGANLYDYAVSGAVCSNKMIYRYLASIFGPFPDVLGYEIPAFEADAKFVNKTTKKPFYTNRQSDNTVYSMWIGTNDLGVGALLTDDQTPGTNITTYIDCIYSSFDHIYAQGGRYMVLMNTAPLQLSPLYASAANHGLTTSHYWPDKPSNITAVSEKMMEYTTTVNTVFQYRTPFEIKVANRYPGAEMVLFDVHSLMTDIWENPSKYLNGTSPLNVTGQYYYCAPPSFSSCTNQPGSPDSYLWYDELHPSQRSDQIIASEFIKVVAGKSKYAAYWS